MIMGWLIFFLGMMIGVCLGFAAASLLNMAKDQTPEF
jgi:uncharacterized membrane-anchored protein YhcB (DUF1043 family)